MATFEFNADQAIQTAKEHGVSNDFELIKPGKYIAHIYDAEMKVGKKGDCTYISVQFEIETAPYAGRRLFNSYIIKHTNERVMQIGLSQFALLCKAIGIPQLHDTDELVRGKSCVITVAVDNGERKDGTRVDPSNVIKRVDEKTDKVTLNIPTGGERPW